MKRSGMKYFTLFLLAVGSAAIGASSDVGQTIRSVELKDQPNADPLKLHQSLVDMHYADPSKVILLAKALNVCPPKVFLVGCQPEHVDDAVEGLRPPVERAVPLAVQEVLSLIDELLSVTSPSA